MGIMAKINKLCGRCGGTGKVIQSPFVWIDAEGNQFSSIEIDCPECNGTGSLIFGHNEELLTACRTSLILENTDSNEYTTLDVNKKGFYNLLISAGTLDMTEGSKAYDLLLTLIFPVGTISYTKIINALGQL